jgi:hypothetical protein
MNKIDFLKNIDGWIDFCSIAKSTEDKKEELITMAKNKEPRPNKYTHPLGTSLMTYTNYKAFLRRGNRSGYDAEFDRQIRILAPSWFVETARENKEKLLALASSGSPRPIGKHKLANGLKRYTNENQNSYDQEFDLKIRNIAPSWFIDIALEKKKQIIELAKTGIERPIAGKHPLGSCLSNYVSQKGRSFDKVFNQQIREIAPHWFNDVRTNANKRRLLDMAKQGQPKPASNKGKKKHPLGSILRNYIGSSCRTYDQEFTNKIRELAPHWFVDKVAENKLSLLELASSSKLSNKPSWHGLGRFLYFYTNSNSESYDSEFDKKIRLLAPHWFIDTVVENKNKLLDMALRKEAKPHHSKYNFRSYTKQNSKCYDLEFDKKIRELAPHWFIDSVVENKKQLLEMARNGEQRPNQKKHPLGRTLSNYTRDIKFKKKLERLAPHWFDRKILVDKSRSGSIMG